MKAQLGKLLLALAALATLASGPPAARADFFLGVSYTGRQLVSIDSTTGVGTLAGTLAPGLAPTGLASRGGSFYTFDVAGNAIRQINPFSGSTAASFNLGFAPSVGQGGLAFRGDGIGFLSTILDPAFNLLNNLYSFNLATGTSQLIARTGPTLTGLAFVGNTLYGLGKADNTLYTVNTATGATSVVGTLFADPNDPDAALGSPIESLTSGPGGLLYATLDDRLFSLDSTTGRATAIGSDSIGFSSISGIAFVSTVPEPASCLLVGFGVAASLAGARARRRA